MSLAPATIISVSNFRSFFNGQNTITNLFNDKIIIIRTEWCLFLLLLFTDRLMDLFFTVYTISGKHCHICISLHVTNLKCRNLKEEKKAALEAFFLVDPLNPL